MTAVITFLVVVLIVLVAGDVVVRVTTPRNRYWPGDTRAERRRAWRQSWR